MSVATFWNRHADKPHCGIPPPPHPTYDFLAVIKAALDEDDGGLGDATCLATIDEGTTATATFLAKADGVLAGLAIADAVFEMCDPSLVVKWQKNDGDELAAREVFGTVTGNARAILRAERVALNFMQRMSGIATLTRHMVNAVKGHKTRILETRKTVPGLRLIDKWAVLIGGGNNHRIGLFDMIMIKDNHIAAAGGLSKAVEKAKAYVKASSRRIEIEVETRTLEEVEEVVECLKADSDKLVTRVMLDNMAKKDASCAGGVDISMLKSAVSMIEGRALTEASGNITLETVAAIAASGCDCVSCGALTHSVKALDISFNVELDL